LLIGRECGRKVWCAREASANVCGLELLEGVWEEGTGVARCKNVVARACRQHTSAYVSIPLKRKSGDFLLRGTSGYVRECGREALRVVDLW